MHTASGNAKIQAQLKRLGGWLLNWRYDDGGRAAAGYRGKARDCAARAVAIATGLRYELVYRMLAEAARREEYAWDRARNHPRTGMRKHTVERFLRGLGWRWIGTGRGVRPRIRLRPETLPRGPVIVALSSHVCAVVDGVIHDTHDSSGCGRRWIYGYWLPPVAPREQGRLFQPARISAEG